MPSLKIMPDINLSEELKTYETKTGFIQASLSKIQGFFKDFQGYSQFSRTKSLRKNLILVLKFYFRNARLR